MVGSGSNDCSAPVSDPSRLQTRKARVKSKSSFDRMGDIELKAFLFSCRSCSFLASWEKEYYEHLSKLLGLRVFQRPLPIICSIFKTCAAQAVIEVGQDRLSSWILDNGWTNARKPQFRGSLDLIRRHVAEAECWKEDWREQVRSMSRSIEVRREG